MRRIDELADGMGGSVDVVTEAKIGPYRESRIKAVQRPPARNLLTDLERTEIRNDPRVERIGGPIT